MSHKDLERLIQEQYASQQSDLDRDALWSRVYPEIKKDKKRPLWAWMLVSGVLIIGVVLVSWIWNKPSQESVSTTLAVEYIDEVIDILEGEKVNAEEISSSVEPGSQTSIVVEDDVLAEKQDWQKPFSAPLRYDIPSNQISFSNGNDQSQIFNQWVSSKGKIASLRQNSRSVNSSKENFSFFIKGKERALLSIASLGLKPNFNLDYRRELMELPEVSVALKKEFFSRTSMDFMFAYGLSRSRYVASNPSAEAASIARSSNEEALDQIGGQLNYNYLLTPHWGIRAGLDYRMLTDRSTHIFGNSQIVSGDNVLLEVKKNADGSIVEVYGFGEELEVTTIEKTRYNYYHSIGLPIGAFYNADMGTMSYELGVGVRINKLIALKGFTQIEEGTAYDLSLDIDKQYGRLFNTEMILNAGIIYSFSDKLGWKTAFEINYGLDGLNSELNPVSQKYNLFKITTGLRYQF